MTKKVAILGGGLSGLSSALFLANAMHNAGFRASKVSGPQHPIHLITDSGGKEQLGGWLKTIYWRDILSAKQLEEANQNGSIAGIQNKFFEKGPRTFRAKSESTMHSLKLLHELDLLKDVVYEEESSDNLKLKRYVIHNGQVKEFSDSFIGFLGLLPHVLRFLWNDMRLTKPDLNWGDLPYNGDISIHEFLTKRVAPGTSNFLVDALIPAMMHGIYGGDYKKLSISALKRGYLTVHRQARGTSLLRQLYKNQKESNMTMDPIQSGLFKNVQDYKMAKSMDSDLASVPWIKEAMKKNSIFYLKNGMSSLVDAMATELANTGLVKIHYNQPVVSIAKQGDAVQVKSAVAGSNDHIVHSFDHVISTLPAHVMANILESGSSNSSSSSNYSLKMLRERVKYTNIGVVNLLYLIDDSYLKMVTKPGFGVLASPQNFFNQDGGCECPLLGIIFDSQLWTGPGAETKEKKRWCSFTVMMGGHHWDTFEGESNGDDDKSSPVKTFMSKALGMHEKEGLERSGPIEIESINPTEPIAAIYQYLRDGESADKQVVDAWLEKICTSKCPSNEPLNKLLHYAIGYVDKFCRIPIGSVVAHHTSIARDCIPQPMLGHMDTVGSTHVLEPAIHEEFGLEPEKLILTSNNYRNGVSINDVIRMARLSVEKNFNIFYGEDQSTGEGEEQSKRI